MTRLLTALLALLVAAPLFAQTASQAQLRVVIVDETGASLPGAMVSLTPPGGEPITAISDERGIATLPSVPIGNAQLHVEFPGFTNFDLAIATRRGANTQNVTMKIAGVQEQVEVKDTSATDDRRGNSFTTTLEQAEIEQLPDDPDDLADVLNQMTGGLGAVFQVNGFRGGRLPSRDEIRQIRFRTNSFAADNHDAGRVLVEIITKPNTRNWSGNANLGIRNDVLNARNPFAAEKTPEEINRFNTGIRGPLVAGKTALRLNIDGNRSTDSNTIYALNPDGSRFGTAFQQPSDRTNITAGIEHALTNNQTLRLEFRNSDNHSHNLGVGGFNLQDRAYTRTGSEQVLRAQIQGIVGHDKLNEFRFQYDGSHNASTSLSGAPTIIVQDAFTTGGAGLNSDGRSKLIEVADDLDFSFGRKHAMRAGFLFDGGRYSNFDASNAAGTFTFINLAAYNAGLPSQFTQRVGQGQDAFNNYQLGLYWQDDIRVNKAFSYSVGVREEMQGLISDKLNIMPRAAFTANPFGPKTTIRGGWGMFYDWYDTGLYDTTLRENGIEQSDLLIQNPGYPNPALGALNLVTLPGGRVIADPNLKMPYQHQATIGIERTVTANMSLQASYQMLRGRNLLRSINANAPDASGIRPEPTVGTITEIQSTGSSQSDRLNVTANYRFPQRRIFLNANYQLARVYNYADSPLQLPANSFDPNAEWGPSIQDVRHRMNALINFPLPDGFRMNLQANAQSGMPYNITTGRDNNSDGAFTDRPAGVGRNSGRGDARFDMSMRFGKTIGFGGPRGGGGGIAQGGNGGGRQGAGRTAQQVGVGGGGRAPGGGGRGGQGGFDGANQRFTMELYVQGNNIFNRTNFTAYSGNILSPLFGQPIAASQARRLEVGAQFRF